MTDFPTLSYTSTFESPEYPFIYLKPENRAPLSGGAPPFIPLQGVSPRDQKKETIGFIRVDNLANKALPQRCVK